MNKLLLLLLVLLSASFCNAQRAPSAATLTALMQKAGVPGMQLVYARGSEVQAYARDYAPLASPPP